MRAVNLHGSDIRTEADQRIVLSVFGDIDAEPLVKVRDTDRTDRNRHVDISSADPAETHLPVHQDIIVLDPDAAIVLKLPDRLLIKAPVFHGQFSRDRHLAHKAQVMQSAGGSLPVLHPCDHDPASVLRHKSLRRIKIKTVIDCVDRLPEKVLCLAVERADHTDRCISRMKFQTDRRHLDRAHKKDMTAVKRKEVRAFPHSSVLVVAGGKNAHEFPGKRILALIKENHTAPVGTFIYDNRIVCIVFPPDFRIPEILYAASLRKHIRTDHRVPFIFFIINAVPECYALGLEALNAAALISLVPDTRVHEKMPSVRHLNGTSREAAAAVVLLVRSHRGRETLPPDKVPRLNMAPVHRAPPDIIGVILEK